MPGFSTEIAFIVLMLCFNAVFAAYEMALASVSKARILHLKEKLAPGAASAFFMKDHLEAGLAVIQMGITMAGAAAAATGGAGVDEYAVPALMNQFGMQQGPATALGITLFVLPLSLFSILFGELIPKVFAIENNELVLLKLSPLFRFLYRLSMPLLVVLEFIIKAAVRTANKLFPSNKKFKEHAGISELRLAAAQARAQSLIGGMEEKIVNSAARLALRNVEDLLTPVESISYLPAEMKLPDALIRAHMDLHTRFPVARKEGVPGEITGYVNFKDIVNALKMGSATADVAGITRPIEKIPAGTPAPRALEEMVAKNIHMAVITGEDGQVAGLLTLEDIIEQLIGSMEDEYDRLPRYVYSSGAGLIAGGGVKIAKVYRGLGLKWKGETLTLAAWLERSLGRAPAGSDLVKAGGIVVLVRKTRRRKASECLVTLAAPDEGRAT